MYIYLDDEYKEEIENDAVYYFFPHLGQSCYHLK